MPYLSQSNDALLGTHATAFDHDEVLLDDTVVRETTHRVDRLLGCVKLGGAVISACLADAVDLLVELCAMMIALLASAWNGPLHARRMPRANAGDLCGKKLVIE